MSNHEVPDDLWAVEVLPFLALFDVLGRRWALRVIWELRAGPVTFRALQAITAPISSSVLTDRLRELRSAGLVDHEQTVGYRLTPLGDGVADKIIDLYSWLKTQPTWPPDEPNRRD